AYNDKSSTLLTLRFYAHLIAKQEGIREIGSITMLDSAKKLSNKIKMQLYKNEKRGKNSFSSYLAPLREVLINEDTLKMLFSKQDCSREQL
ncbi:MAG: hypothetical protein U9N33_07545, partial [Campylobacterota bacterium]|nr:hypothetical protein [Campylobacterota bacterium]